MSEMIPQQEGIIEKIEDTNLQCVQRLMTFGLVEGASVKYIGSAIGGDPLEMQIHGSTLTLRKDCASHFTIKDIT